MKRIIVLLILIAFTATGITFAQGDARVLGLGNAFTAVADDMNSLFFNPAGLAYLKKGYLDVGATGRIGLKKDMMFEGNSVPSVWVRDGVAVTYDDFTGGNLPINILDFLDPTIVAEWGLDDDNDGVVDEGMMQSAVDAYNELVYQPYQPYKTMRDMYDIGVTPRAMWVGKGWGVAALQKAVIRPVVGSYEGENTPISIAMDRYQGAVAGIGLKLGIISVGANVKLIKVTTDTLSFVPADLQDPNAVIEPALSGPESEDEGVNTWNRIEAGLGSIVTFGSISAGAYIDNLLGFLADDGSINFGGIFDAASVGIAWTPFNNKLAKARSILNMIAAVDFKNIGSLTDRQLCAGVETGLNLGEVIVANVRFGYKQKMPGDLAEVASTFDLKQGTYTAGFGAKFLFVTMDFSAELPADMVLDPPSYPLEESRRGTPLGHFALSAALNF